MSKMWDLCTYTTALHLGFLLLVDHADFLHFLGVLGSWDHSDGEWNECFLFG